MIKLGKISKAVLKNEDLSTLVALLNSKVSIICVIIPIKVDWIKGENKLITPKTTVPKIPAPAIYLRIFLMLYFVAIGIINRVEAIKDNQPLLDKVAINIARARAK